MATSQHSYWLDTSIFPEEANEVESNYDGDQKDLQLSIKKIIEDPTETISSNYNGEEETQITPPKKLSQKQQ